MHFFQAICLYFVSKECRQIQQSQLKYSNEDPDLQYLQDFQYNQQQEDQYQENTDLQKEKPDLQKENTALRKSQNHPSRSEIRLNQSRQVPSKRLSQSKVQNAKRSKSTIPVAQDSLPRYNQIQKCLQTLKLIVPELFPPDFIDQIFSLSSQRLLGKTKTIQPAQKPKRRYNRGKKVKKQQIVQEPIHKQEQDAVSDEFSNGAYQLEDQVIQNQIQLKYQYSTYEAQPRDSLNTLEIMKIIAKIFCEFGNNQELLGQAVRQMAQRAQRKVWNYKQMLDNIVLNAFTKLQSFLIQECRQKVYSLLLQFGKKSLSLVLLDCTKKLTPQTCELFLDIIRGQYQLKEVNITPQQAASIYKEVRKSLDELSPVKKSGQNRPLGRYALPQDDMNKSSQNSNSGLGHVFRKRNRVKNPNRERQKGYRQMDQVRKMNKVWNHRYEMQLIKSYKNYKTISDIKSHFQQMYSQDADYFSTVALRSKLYSILRSAIKKFYTFIENNEAKLPPMAKIGHNQIRWIIYNNEGQHIRLYLLNIYTSSQYDELLIKKTIESITQYTEEIHRNLKLSQMIEECNHHKKMTEKLKSKLGNNKTLQY